MSLITYHLLTELKKSSFEATRLLELISIGLSKIVEDYFLQVNNIPLLVKMYKSSRSGKSIRDIYENVINSPAYYKRIHNPDLWTIEEIKKLFDFINHDFDVSDFEDLLKNIKSIIQLSGLNYKSVINKIGISQDMYFRRLNNPEIFTREELIGLVKLLETELN